MSDPTTAQEAPLHIVKLLAENVMRLKAVAIEPKSGNLIRITGRNGAGKSSVLNAIAYALGGVRLQPDVPVRDGETRAQVQLALAPRHEGEAPRQFSFTVIRRWTAKGQSLTVKDGEGNTVKKPQDVLDAICGALTFDPLAFARMDRAKQYQQLAAIAGLDFTATDQVRAKKYEQRTEANREVKRLTAQLERAEFYPEAGNQLQNNDELRRRHAEALDSQNALIEARASFNRAQEALERQDRRVEEVRREWEAAVNQQKALKEDREEARAELQHREESALDPETYSRDLTQIAETNDKVRANQRRNEIAEELNSVNRKAAELSAQIEDLDNAKRDAIREAQLPVEGLGMEGGVVTYNSLPLDQCAWSEQLRVSAAVAIKANPNLRIMLVRDGALLDSDSRAQLAAMAQGAKCDVWLEQATDGEPVGIVIEEGEVKSVNEEANDVPDD